MLRVLVVFPSPCQKGSADVSTTESFLDRRVVEDRSPFKRPQADPVVADQDAEYGDWHCHCHVSPLPYETIKRGVRPTTILEKIKTCIDSIKKQKGEKETTHFQYHMEWGEMPMSVVNCLTL